MRNIFLIILLLFASTFSAFGVEKSQTVNRQENWYAYISLGYAPSLMETGVEEDYRSMFVGINSDLFRAYWPVGKSRQLLLGFGMNVQLFRGYNLNQNDPNDVFNIITVSGGALYFINKVIGDGAYLRGDIGWSQIANSSSNDFYGQGEGISFLIGIGKSFPLNDETRFLIELNYLAAEIRNDYLRRRYHFFVLKCGLLF